MIENEKIALRNEMRKVLAEIAPQKLNDYGKAAALHIEAWLLKIFGERPIKAGFFKSFKDEIDTSALEKLLINKSSTGAIALVDSNDELCFLSHMGPMDPRDFDVIFVPGLAFDEKGRRLGRGKGHFDRALSKLLGRKCPLFMGLALDEQLVNKIPCEAHDIPMDFICTPKLGVIKTTRD